jgi:pyruvate dehydrogenase E1 component
MDGRAVRRHRPEGPERAHFLLEQLLEHARQNSIDLPFSANTGYVNTIEPDQEARCPGNIAIEAPARLHALERHGHGGAANRLHPADGGDLGGHIGSFASLASMFGAGFNHFWHAESETTAATASTSRATARPASTPAPTWKAA